MEAFEYHQPSTVADALRVGGADSKYLAGGQSLLPAMKLGLAAPSALVSLRDLGELRTIKRQDGRLVIGAMATHATVASDATVISLLPALAELAEGIGDRQVRNLGTLGGSLANNDPAACYPAALLALKAEVITDRRTIPGDDFLRGLYETALEEGEIIREVSFEVPRAAAYEKFRQPASRFALVGVFVAQFANEIRVAVTGAQAIAYRCKPLEDALSKELNGAACDRVKLPSEGLNADMHASSDYRAALISVLAKRAVERLR